MIRCLTLTSLILIAGCSMFSEGEVPANLISGHEYAFSDKNIHLQVLHQDMEVSEACPKVTLRSSNAEIRSEMSLCKVNILGYPNALDAKTDFAFIEFSEYALSNSTFTYTIDGSLSRGSAFIATCSISIVEQSLTSSQCEAKPLSFGGHQ